MSRRHLGGGGSFYYIGTNITNNALGLNQGYQGTAPGADAGVALEGSTVDYEGTTYALYDVVGSYFSTGGSVGDPYGEDGEVETYLGAPVTVPEPSPSTMLISGLVLLMLRQVWLCAPKRGQKS